MREDWIECNLDEVCFYSKGKKPPVLANALSEINNVPYINIKAFEKGIIDEYTNGDKCNLCEDGDLLMVWDGARAGLTGKAKKGAVGSTLMKIEEVKGIEKEYLYYFLLSLFTKINTNPRGVGIPHVEPRILWLSKILIVSNPIQRAIVSKIEALFSDLDNGIANFKKAQEQLKVYRQAVLKKAFEGGYSITNEELRITESIVNDVLRMTNDGNQSNHINQKNHSSDNLPKGWKWVKISDVCDMKAGYFIKADEINSEFENGLFPCYGGNGLRGYVKSTTHEGLFPIVGRQGALCGNVHLVNGKFHATEHAVVVTAKKEIDIKCLYYKLVEMKLNQYSTGTAQPGLSVNKIIPIEIIYPNSLEEQTAIVQEIESRLSVTDNLEFVIRNSIEKAEALRQSILKKAFEGKLLSEAEIEQCKQAADYEPAGELLKKITNEKLRITNEKKLSVKKKSKQ